MSRMPTWTIDDIPSQHGRTAIVTGGTEGVGFEIARALLNAGGRVIVAARDPGKGARAVNRIGAGTAIENVRFEVLDLADRSSIIAFADRTRVQLDTVDLLINNAGIMAPARRRTTVDGFELQFGLNVLGHFLLTGLLLPLLRAGSDSRVVTLSSIASRDGMIDFDDLQSTRRYRPMTAYAQSKLGNLMFALELERRSVDAGWGIESYAVHPGLARTNLFAAGPGSISSLALIRRVMGPLVFQSAAKGALSTLFAATSEVAVPGSYYGPRRLGEIRGPVGLAKVPVQALDPDVSARLWTVAEELTGFTWQRASHSPV
ncbi:MAG: SDR family oxidoreductase [Thermomicrobiales bacterium]